MKKLNALLVWLRYPAVTAVVVLSVLRISGKIGLQWVWCLAPLWGYFALIGATGVLLGLAVQYVRYRWGKALALNEDGVVFGPAQDVELTADEIVAAGLTDYYLAMLPSGTLEEHERGDRELDLFIEQLEAGQSDAILEKMA